jgi:hypothetical protein
MMQRACQFCRRQDETGMEAGLCGHRRQVRQRLAGGRQFFAGHLAGGYGVGAKPK